MFEAICRFFSVNASVQSGNVVAGDLAGGDVYIDGVRQGGAIQPKGVVRRLVHPVEAFDSLSIVGPFDVYYQVANETSVEIRATENVLPFIKQSISRGKLEISLRANIMMQGLIGVRVFGPGISNLEIVGSGNFRSDRLIGKTLSVKTTGSNSTLLYGKINNFHAVHEGSGLINATGLVALDVVANLTGSGLIKLEAVDSVNASLTGSGAIVINGKPPKVQRHVVGSGYIESRSSPP